jgi:cell division protein FtsL
MATIILANMVYIYLGAAAFGIITAILAKLFYSMRSRAKFKEYQSEIAKSHSRILKLELKNEKLQHRIDELESRAVQPMKIA